MSDTSVANELRGLVDNATQQRRSYAGNTSEHTTTTVKPSLLKTTKHHRKTRRPLFPNSLKTSWLSTAIMTKEPLTLRR